MKKAMICTAVLLVLCGCAAESPVKETVNDVPQEVAAYYGEPTDEFSIDIPQNAQLIWQTDTECYYSVDDGAMDIWVVQTLSHDVKSMLGRLTGMRPDDAEIISDGSSCRYAWYAQSENGGRNCRAVLAVKGTKGLAVICTVDESAGNQYDELLKMIGCRIGTTGEVEI